MTTTAQTYTQILSQLQGGQLNHNYGVYDPYSWVTNNQAEGINYVLKDLQEWWEAPVDCMVLALYTTCKDTVG